MSREKRHPEPGAEEKRIQAFMRGVADRSATRLESSRYGRAIFNEDFKVIWDMNFLRVEKDITGVTGDLLIAEVERLYGPPGYRHRKVMVEDPGGGAAVAAYFAQAGWKVTPLVVMVHRRDPDRRPAPGVAREVDKDTLKQFRTVSQRRAPEIDSEETLRLLVDKIDVWAATTPMRFFAGYAEGRIAAGADLYYDGRTANVEDVATLVEYRGRGVARAVVTLALDEAYAAGYDLVFLTAEADDWPKELYTKLGFDPAFTFFEFLKTPS